MWLFGFSLFVIEPLGIVTASELLAPDKNSALSQGKVGAISKYKGKKCFRNVFLEITEIFPKSFALNCFCYTV